MSVSFLQGSVKVLGNLAQPPQTFENFQEGLWGIAEKHQEMQRAPEIHGL